MDNPFLWLIHTIITLYIWVLIAALCIAVLTVARNHRRSVVRPA